MENIENAAETNNTLENENLENGVASEIADTSKENEIEFTDGGVAEEKDKEQNNAESKTNDANPDNNTKPQKTRSDYARERRKLEQERALKKARYDAIIDTLNGVNPYTQEKMEDDADVDEYLTMREIEKSGKDPVVDYSKFVKAKNKEQAKQQSEASSQKEWITKDREDFATKHPDVNLETLIDDELFKSFAFGKVGKLSMDKIYTDYLAFSTKLEEKARDRASQILANNAATPGKLSGDAPPTQKSYAEMSSDEFEKIVERVRRGERIS